MGKIQAPAQPHRVEELRLGRNYVRKGDLVRITPPEGSPPGTHGMAARFVYADEDNGGLFACVIEQQKNEKGVLVSCGYRFVKPERIERKATTHDPNRGVVERAARKQQRRTE